MGLKYLISPFRYPGAKSRFVAPILESMRKTIAPVGQFVDVFAGGGSVFLGAYSSGLAVRIVVNDVDGAIAAFWTCVGSAEMSAGLMDLIRSTVPTVEEHARQRVFIREGDVLHKGFAALFLNRTSFSGMLGSGPIGGYKQQSRYTVGCRYNAEVLVNNVRAIVVALRNRVDVSGEDFRTLIPQYDREGTIIYCDPPYYEKGNQLYRFGMSDKDHRELSECMRGLKHAAFFVSYDNHARIRELYDWASIKELDVRYSMRGKMRKSWRDDVELLVQRR